MWHSLLSQKTGVPYFWELHIFLFNLSSWCESSLSFLKSSAVTVSGYDSAPGNQGDFYYRLNTGVGGLSGEHGYPGYCVAVIQKDANDQSSGEISLEVKSVLPFTFIPPKASSLNGTIQVFSVHEYLSTLNNNNPDGLNIPSSFSNSTSYFVTFKCWGGGGGGGKISDLVNNVPWQELVHLSTGGGAGFAQITLPVRSNDVFHIEVGGGGQTNQGEQGGRGGWGNGGNG